MKLETPKDVMKALLDGKRIRQAQWDSMAYVCLDSSGQTVDDDGDQFRVNLEYAWQLVPEPKPALYLWAQKSLVGWYMSSSYCTEEQAHKNWPDSELRRLDWSRLEVE